MDFAASLKKKKTVKPRAGFLATQVTKRGFSRGTFFSAFFVPNFVHETLAPGLSGFFRKVKKSVYSFTIVFRPAAGRNEFVSGRLV